MHVHTHTHTHTHTHIHTGSVCVRERERERETGSMRECERGETTYSCQKRLLMILFCRYTSSRDTTTNPNKKNVRCFIYLSISVTSHHLTWPPCSKLIIAYIMTFVSSLCQTGLFLLTPDYNNRVIIMMTFQELQPNRVLTWTPKHIQSYIGLLHQWWTKLQSVYRTR